MKYDELLCSVGCKCIVFFEDDFSTVEHKKEHAIYDISRMSLEDRVLYLNELGEDFAILQTQLSDYLEEFDLHISDIMDWDDTVPKQDIRPAFVEIGKEKTEYKELLMAKYDAIDDIQLQKSMPIAEKFGVGIGYPSYFESLYNDYVRKDQRFKSIRIYKDFSAGTQEEFRKDLALADDISSVVCIVDNNLNGTNRAKEIIDTIKSSVLKSKNNVIGSVFSSKELFEEVGDTLYFEYTSKDEPEGLKAAIAKSCYNYFISRLRKEVVDNLDKAFAAATANKGIAAFLSNKALGEGMSEYQVIVEWVKLMCLLPNDKRESMKQLVSLSKVINSLDIADEIPNPELQKLNTLEAFDYSINDFLMPIMPGDVFTNAEGEWYVLIGQDCDTVRGEGRIPKNTISELLPATVYAQTTFDKWTNDLKKASIFNFKRPGKETCEVLQIDYQKRKYISNEILSLCAFNEDGSCELPLKRSLNKQEEQLLPKHMIDYYSQLQKFYVAVNSLKQNTPNEFDIVIGQAFTPRLISIGDFNQTGDNIAFNLKRVCRLTHNYVFYLFKLYLEYRGRQPFQTINLVQQAEITIPVFSNGKSIECSVKVCTVPLPDKKNCRDWPWYIEAEDVNQVLRKLDCEEFCKNGIELIKVADTITIEKKKIKYKKMQTKVDILVE